MKDTLNYFSLCDPSYLMQLQTATYDTIFSEIEIDSSYVPDGPDCAYIQHGWITHHYEPKDGKYVGVCPLENTFSNFSELRNKWGYSKLYIDPYQNIYDNAIAAGYTLNDILISLTGIPDNQRAGKITQFGNAYAYYIGEPADQNHSMGGIRNALISNGFTSLFVIDGYKRTYGLNVCVEQADKVLFSSYHHWYELLSGVWVSWPYNSDQRPDWSDMKNRYGSKFSMTWINTKEIEEFDVLFGHAQNLGLIAVWIYGAWDDTTPPQPVPHYNDQWENISYAAWKHGFLRRWVQDVTITWRCSLPNCSCNPSCFPNDYYISNVSYGTIQEVFQ